MAVRSVCGCPYRKPPGKARGGLPCGTGAVRQPVDGLDGGEAIRLEVLDRREGRAARREQRYRPGIEHQPRHPPAVRAVQHQLRVSAGGGAESRRSCGRADHSERGRHQEGKGAAACRQDDLLTWARIRRVNARESNRHAAFAKRRRGSPKHGQKSKKFYIRLDDRFWVFRVDTLRRKIFIQILQYFINSA